MAGESVPPAASKHLVFDLDGVLLDSESDLTWLDRALEAALVELEVPDTELARSRLYPATVERVRELAAEFGVDAERLWTVRNAHYVRVKLAAIESGELAPFDDVEVLGDLAAGHDLHIVSNSPQAVVDSFVETNGFERWFDVRLGRGETLEDLDRLKPARYPYEVLVERIGDGDPPRVAADPLVYVGDTETDRAFAERTGMRFVHLTRDRRGVGSLRELAALLE